VTILRLSAALFLAVVACSGPGGSAQSGSALQAGPASGPKADFGLRSGFYIGWWNDGYRTHWLVLYVDAEEQRGVTYDPPEALELCSLSAKGKTVSFRTGQYTLWQAGTPYSMAFKGALDASGIHGQLLVVGGVYSGRVAPIELTYYPVDVGADSALEGVYRSVQVYQETGDLGGDELMLFRSKGRLLALWNSYGGAPNGPYLADSLVNQHGDTTDIVGRWDPDKPWETFSLAFLLSGRPAARPDTSDTTSGAETRPRQLSKTTDVSRFFAPPNSTRCSGTQPAVQGSRHKNSRPRDRG